MEGAILIWFAIGAGIAAGAFLMARSAVEIAVVAYGVLEKRLDPKVATRQTVVLTLAIIVAVIATAIIAGYAILSIFASLIQNGTFE